MKRMLALSMLAVMLMATQVAAEGKLPMGLKVGLNLATVRGDDVEDAKFRTGVSVGGFLEYPVTPLLSVMGEVSYTMKGGKKSYTYAESQMLTDGLTYDETFKLNYIEVPILLKINIPTSGKIMPYLLVGPGIAFNIGADWEQTNGETTTEDLSDFTKSIDLGVIFGGGVGFPVGSHTMSLGARYDLGLSTVDDGLGEHWTEEELDIKNSVISIVGGVAF